MFALLVWALNDRFVLAVHEVNDDRLVAFEISFPTLLSNQFVRSTVVVLVLGVGLVDHSIEVFVEPVQQVGHQLSRVVLVVARKHWLKLGNTFLEVVG